MASSKQRQGDLFWEHTILAANIADAIYICTIGYVTHSHRRTGWRGSKAVLLSAVTKAKPSQIVLMASVQSTQLPE